MQVAAIVLALAATAAGVALLGRTAAGFVTTVRLGQPDAGRTDHPARRTWTLLREFLGHTRMARLPLVAVAHWFVMVSFGVLFFSLVNAYGQLFNPRWVLPLVGHLAPFEWLGEGIPLGPLPRGPAPIGIPPRHHPPRSPGSWRSSVSGSASTRGARPVSAAGGPGSTARPGGRRTTSRRRSSGSCCASWRSARWSTRWAGRTARPGRPPCTSRPRRGSA